MKHANASSIMNLNSCYCLAPTVSLPSVRLHETV